MAKKENAALNWIQNIVVILMSAACFSTLPFLVFAAMNLSAHRLRLKGIFH